MLTWRAVYKDGMCLVQCNEDGTENTYKDIDRYRLVRFDLMDGEKEIHSTYINEGQRLIFRCRNFIRIGRGGEERHMIYLTGWQMTIATSKGFKNVVAINYIYENGSVALDGARNDLQLLDEEVI